LAKLNYVTFKEDPDLMSDPLVQRAIDKLKERWGRIAEYHKENNPEEKCYECGNEVFDYRYNRAICENCGNEVEKEIEHKEAVKIGCASRKFMSVLKEMLAAELGKKAREKKLSEDELRKLPFSLKDFNEAEYTKQEREYLRQRYEELLDEIGRGNYTDTFMVYNLVQQELKILNLKRQDNHLDEIDSMDMKRQMSIYRDLAKDLKAARANRDDVEDRTVLQELAEKADEMELHKEVEKHVKYLEEKHQEYLEKSKERRKEVGNPF